MTKVLIIEDDSYSAQSLAEMLAEYYEVCAARSGEDGLRDASSILPDLILLDIMLPGKMNGFDVLRELQHNQNTTNIPVIMLTNLDGQKKSAVESGAVDCFVKANATFDQIHSVIEATLAKKLAQKA